MKYDLDVDIDPLLTTATSKKFIWFVVKSFTKISLNNAWDDAVAISKICAVEPTPTLSTFPVMSTNPIEVVPTPVTVVSK